MFNQIKQAACFLSIGVFGIVGCSEGNAVNTVAPPLPAQLLNPGVPQTPDAAVRTVLDGLKASKPVVVWDVMPASHQAAFNRMVRDFASAADPEIWKRTVGNLKKIAQLAETKKNFILQSPFVQSAKGIKPEDVKASWDPGLKLFKTIVESELVDQEKMKNFDGRAFLEGTGAKLFAQARALSRSWKNDPLKQIDGWKATVRHCPITTRWPLSIWVVRRKTRSRSLSSCRRESGPRGDSRFCNTWLPLGWIRSSLAFAPIACSSGRTNIWRKCGASKGLLISSKRPRRPTNFKPSSSCRFCPMSSRRPSSSTKNPNPVASGVPVAKPNKGDSDGVGQWRPFR